MNYRRRTYGIVKDGCTSDGRKGTLAGPPYILRKVRFIIENFDYHLSARSCHFMEFDDKLHRVCYLVLSLQETSEGIELEKHGLHG